MSAQQLSHEEREDFLDILDAYNCDIVSYYSSFSKIFDCHSAAYLLSYMIKKSDESKTPNEFYATDETICKEADISDKQFNMSLKKVIQSGIFSKKRRGNHYTNTYTFNQTRLREWFRKIRRGEND